MAYLLGDIYIGDYRLTQSFGARPDIYFARFNLKGHDGIDIGCPSLTPVLAAADGFVYKTGFDTAGFGNFIKLVHGAQNAFYKTVYAHLNDFTVKAGDRVIAGQLIGHSNNTGFSDAPHLHFGVAPCDANGVDLEPGNGYAGYIDPNGESCHWEIRNLTAPVNPSSQEIQEPVKVPPSDFTRMVSQGSSFKVVVSYLQGKGLTQFLTTHGNAPVDLDHPDPLDGEKTVTFLAQVFEDMRHLADQSPQVASLPTPDQVLSQMPQQEKDNALRGVLETIRRFIVK